MKEKLFSSFFLLFLLFPQTHGLKEKCAVPSLCQFLVFALVKEMPLECHPEEGIA